VGAARQALDVTRIALALVLLALPRVLEAQVGLTSGMAQVTLVARVAPRGTIQGVSPQRETGNSGSVRESSVTVRLAANAGYQLIVRGTATPTSRIWVRSANGEFQELRAGSAVVVARDPRGGGEWERSVHYRIETSGNGAPLLPVRYEIAIAPTI
jgi:hypothetical protein